MPRIGAQGISGCAATNPGAPSEIREAASPINSRFRTTACWVRLSRSKAAKFSPSVPGSLGHLLNPKHQPLGTARSGRASAITCARIRAGKSPGVTTSTGTPNISSSSTCSPPRSNKVVPGCGSTSRSRSLPSLSVPCRTDPNTRGLRTWNRVAASRIVSTRCRSTSDGFMDHLKLNQRHHLTKGRSAMQSSSDVRHRASGTAASRLPPNARRLSTPRSSTS